jgi:hypothetical protein
MTNEEQVGTSVLGLWEYIPGDRLVTQSHISNLKLDDKFSANLVEQQLQSGKIYKGDGVHKC